MQRCGGRKVAAAAAAAGVRSSTAPSTAPSSCGARRCGGRKAADAAAPTGALSSTAPSASGCESSRRPEIRPPPSSARSEPPSASTNSSSDGVRGRAGGRRAGHPPVLRQPAAPMNPVATRLSSPSHSEARCGGGGGDAAGRLYKGRWWRRNELFRPTTEAERARAVELAWGRQRAAASPSRSLNSQ